MFHDLGNGAVDLKSCVSIPSACTGARNIAATATTMESWREGSPTSPPRRAAIVGSGGAGLSAALLLHDAGLHVSLFEAEAHLGGHCLTLPLPANPSTSTNMSATPCVDVGFQVYNLTTYPIFSTLLRRLRVNTLPSEMSFSLSASRGGADPKSLPFEWGSHGLSSIFTTFSRFFFPSVWIMVIDMMRWNWTCPQVLRSPKKWAHISVREYLRQCRFTQIFQELYLLPMCSAIWSMPSADCLDMPILTLVRFFKNHCLLNMPWRRPLWRVVQRGSNSYVNKIAEIVDQVYSSTKVIKLEAINKGKDGINVIYGSSQGIKSKGAAISEEESLQCQHFDMVILCCHTPEILQIVKNSMEPNIENAEFSSLCPLLEKLKYSSSRVIVHSDKALMPRDKRVWASWNCFKTLSSKDKDQQREPVFVTYWANRLQPDSLRDYKDIFVTLNPPADLPEKKYIYAEYNLQHPILTASAFDVQEKINSVFCNGSLGLAGAWARYGFHEDAMNSTLNVLEKLPVDLPSYVYEAKALVPFPSWKQWFNLKAFTYFTKAAIIQGKLVVVLPSGHELEFGRNCEAAPQSKIQVTDWNFFGSVLRESDIGLGKSYISKMYYPSGATTLVDLMAILSLNANNAYNVRGRQGYAASFSMLAYRCWNWIRRNTISNSRINISEHYDIGDEFYKTFLDTSLTYSSAIFSSRELEVYEKIFYSGQKSHNISSDKLLNLDCLYAAQMRKLDKIIEIGEITDNSSVLEIGCGWGSFLNRCLERGVGKSFIALTISENQYKHAQKLAANATDSCEVSVEFCDYREVMAKVPMPTSGFNRICSIEMLEAVGHENLRSYFKTVSNCLAPGGIAVIQAICTKDENYADYCRTSDFIRACIFPGGHLPCVSAIQKSLPEDLILCRVIDIGEHYAPTLYCWRNAMMNNAHKFDESLIRRFEFYFAYCEAGFATRHIRNCIIRLEKQ